MSLKENTLLRFERVRVEQTLTLRQQVLWPDLPIDKVRLAEDEKGWHFAAFVENGPATKDEDNDPIAVISLFLETLPDEEGGVPKNDSDSPRISVRFRKFACKHDMQGRGVGTALLKHALHFSRSALNARDFWCDARVSSVGWYQRRGLAEFGNRFYKGPVEYVRMKMELQ